MAHVTAKGRHVEASLGGGAHHMRAKPGPGRSDAVPVVSSRHCSPFLHGSCPPACLRYMGSARANRSGWSPGSEWKELVKFEPRGAASGEVVVYCSVRRSLQSLLLTLVVLVRWYWVGVVFPSKQTTCGCDEALLDRGGGGMEVWQWVCVVGG